MIRRILAAILVCAAGTSTVAAQGTPIFLRPPSANAAIREGISPALIADYPGTPDIRAIAENALRDKPFPLMFPLPRGQVSKIEERRFEPIEGFTVTEAGEVVIDPGASNTDLSFNWYGVGRGIELRSHVYKGRLSGSLSTADLRCCPACFATETCGRTALSNRRPPSMSCPRARVASHKIWGHSR